MDDDHLRTPAFCMMEVALPIPITHEWVVYACQRAGLDRPVWVPAAEAWTTSSNDARHDAITVFVGADQSVRVLGEWTVVPASRGAKRPPSKHETRAVVRRFVSVLVTSMEAALRDAQARRPRSAVGSR